MIRLAGHFWTMTLLGEVCIYADYATCGISCCFPAFLVIFEAWLGLTMLYRTRGRMKGFGVYRFSPDRGRRFFKNSVVPPGRLQQVAHALLWTEHQGQGIKFLFSITAMTRHGTVPS